MKPPARVADDPSAFRTTTSTAPAAAATGVVARISASPVTDTPTAGLPPKRTVAPARKPAPRTVTGVPPDRGPRAGSIESTLGPVVPVENVRTPPASATRLPPADTVTDVPPPAAGAEEAP